MHIRRMGRTGLKLTEISLKTLDAVLNILGMETPERM